MAIAPAFRGNGVRPAAGTAVLAGLGALTVASYVYGERAHIPDNFAVRTLALAQTLLFGGAAWMVLTGRVARGGLTVILLVALLCRIPLVLSPPKFSADIYRYIWDGRVQGAGVNPYRYVPADPALAGLRDAAIYPHVSRRDYAHTIYPPAAQAIFLAVTRVSQTVTAMKAAVVAFEGGTVWLLCLTLGLAGLPRERVLLYAWHPLVLWQYAGDGHIDAAAITFILVAVLAHLRRRESLTGIALGCATLVKLYPALLVLAFYRRGTWKMPAALAATVAAGYLPYLGVGTGVIGFLPGYAAEEGIVTGDRFLGLTLARLAGVAAPVAAYAGAALLMLFLLAYRVWRTERRTALGDLGYGATVAAAFLVLLSTHYLWYFGWLVALACFTPRIALLYMTGAALWLFSALWYRPWFGINDEMLAFDIALYGPTAGLALAERFGAEIRGRLRRGALRAAHRRRPGSPVLRRET